MKNAAILRPAAALLLLSAAATSARGQPIQLTEFPVGGNAIPIAVGSDGNFWMWFSGTTAVGRLTPAGIITSFNTGFPFPGSLPGHCVSAPDGAVWCSNGGGNALLRIDATTGASTTFPLPVDHDATDLTVGPDGALWYTGFGFNRIGRMTLTGGVTEYPVPAEFEAPRSITAGPDGALWFTSNNAQVGRMDTAGGGFRYYDLPEHATNIYAQPSAITTGIDGNLWLGVLLSSGPGRIVRVTPGGQITEFPLTDPAGSAIDLTPGPDGAIWFTEPSASKIGRITIYGVLTEYDLPPGSSPVGITVGRDGAIWFTESGTLRVGRLSGGPLGNTSIPTLSPALLGVLGAALALGGWALLRAA